MDTGIVQRSIELLRKQFGEKIAIITDVCLCQYTSDGHCGLVLNKKIDNDKSLDALAKVAVSHAMAGVDIVAPSAMMDGEVQALRKGLDDAEFTDVAIMGYSAKQASPLYAPFRDADSFSAGIWRSAYISDALLKCKGSHARNRDRCCRRS